MHILIIDQCSASKAVPESFDSFDEDALDQWTREELIEKDRVPVRLARELYTGQQQQYISQAVARLRAAGDIVDRVFISAGFGVVDEDVLLPPYDVTFTGRSEADIIERSRELEIAAALQEVMIRTPPYDVIFFALGHDYYLGIDLSALVEKLGNTGRQVRQRSSVR